MRKSLNDITTADLEEIKKFSGWFYTPREIAIILEIDVEFMIDACQEEGNQLHQAFYAGQLISESELRSSILKLAKSGSSPAQTMALEMLNNTKMKMFDR